MAGAVLDEPVAGDPNKPNSIEAAGTTRDRPKSINIRRGPPMEHSALLLAMDHSHMVALASDKKRAGRFERCE